MAEITVQLDLKCSQCPDVWLTAKMVGDHLEVDPCQKCVDFAYDLGAKEATQ